MLNGGLEILRTADLRAPLAALELPLLRIYGYLDGLVRARSPSCSTPPGRILRRSSWPKPPMRRFSHPDEFVTMIEAFIAAH